MTIEKNNKIPQILAPAGGREQFFAALYSGADAVFLGLQKFNARARATNFSVEDLAELVPIAKKYGMKVFVTLNILIKEDELTQLLDTLQDLEWLEVDGIIIQDIATFAMAKRFCPKLRLHASTQLAIHNLWGVKFASFLGFQRVVLARELTATEIKKISAYAGDAGLEIEAFCHGSLCYSYSGLCFFSGAKDSRSGNRGECAYTCRKPYKVLNEPGQGFLFSMKDLNTVEHLDLLVNANVHTLKIEGRKKDAQYVTSVVSLYRHKLNSLFGSDTLRKSAPARARQFGELKYEDIEKNLQLSYQRLSTSLFLKGRYHENVIDLDNPTHRGLLLGTVTEQKGPWIRLTLCADIERFDGIKIQINSDVYHALPQHGVVLQTHETNLQDRYRGEEIQFSLREMRRNGESIVSAKAGETVEILLPNSSVMPGKSEPLTGELQPSKSKLGSVQGYNVVKVRSSKLKSETEKLTRADDEGKFLVRGFFDIEISQDLQNPKSQNSLVCFELVGKKLGEIFYRSHLNVPKIQAKNPSLTQDLRHIFEVFGAVGFQVSNLALMVDESLFVPRASLKAWKNSIAQEIASSYVTFLNQRKQQALKEFLPNKLPKIGDFGQSSANESLSSLGDFPYFKQMHYVIKIDRLEYFDFLVAFIQKQKNFPLAEIIFEPKRAFLNTVRAGDIAAKVLEGFDRVRECLLAQNANSFGQDRTLAPILRLALPTVVRAWDEPLLKSWFTAFSDSGVKHFEVGNPGALPLLQSWNLVKGDVPLQLSADFTVYALNSVAANVWARLGIGVVTLSVEDDFTNQANILRNWPAELCVPQVILYKDTPLFVAESCSLTALHNGCPTSAVCGYRTLEIENAEGERFFVAHESCKSIVYGKEAYCATQHLGRFQSMGVSRFRLDFLTRAYEQQGFHDVLFAALEGVGLSGTHDANFQRKLL